MRWSNGHYGHLPIGLPSNTLRSARTRPGVPVALPSSWSTALIQIVPNLAIFFGTYEPLRVLYRDITPSSFSDWGSPIAGGAAGVIAKTAVFPLDLLRKRLQVQGVTRTMYIHRNIPIYSSAWTALHIIVRHEGVHGLFKGLTVSLVKAAPNSAITMFMYEHVMLFLSSRSS
jgi:solute carrier family 25 thiamine pyrophosphate transporter 19